MKLEQDDAGRRAAAKTILAQGMGFAALVGGNPCCDGVVRGMILDKLRLVEADAVRCFVVGNEVSFTVEGRAP